MYWVEKSKFYNLFLLIWVKVLTTFKKMLVILKMLVIKIYKVRVALVIYTESYYLLNVRSPTFIVVLLALIQINWIAIVMFGHIVILNKKNKLQFLQVVNMLSLTYRNSSLRLHLEAY